MSRMDKYYKNSSNKRTNRNQELYDKIYEDGEYSNIEGIAAMDNSHEIDISKIKKMLKNHENSNNREFGSYDESKLEFPKYETIPDDANRVYDIRDILSNAKSNKEEERYHNLDKTSVDLLKELRQKNEAKEEHLEEMVDTITNTSKLNKLSDHDLGLEMFEDLKSNDTVLPEKESIKSILEEAKKQEMTNTGLDNSFFTSSMSFKDQDFEEISELNKNVKKNNVLIKVLFFIILVGITIGAIIFVFNLLK